MHRRLGKGLVALFALVCLIVLMVTALASSTPQPKPMTILDYYLALPQKYLKFAGGDSATERSAALYIKDVETGYLQARQPNGEFYSAVALFKRSDGSDLVAVENRECAAGCNEEFYLLSYESGQWNDVTAKTLPAMKQEDLRATLAKQFKAREGFEPRVMHRLTSGGASIDVSEYWSGIGLGRLEWINGEFIFKPLASDATNATARNVLASVSNAEGDRLEIIEVGPESPAHLPLKGHLNVKIAYQLRSARACRIWARPVVLEERLPDEFTHGSMLYLQGSGELTTWFGFDNQAHLQQFKVLMVDDEKKNLLTLNYSVDARWEGVLKCPTFRVECFPNDFSSPNSPLACMVYPSGVHPEQKFDYNWTISAGTITSGQGTRRIILNTEGIQEKSLTAEVLVSIPVGKCVTNASYTVPLGNAGKTTK
jgi:hypothetical protein